MNLLQAVNPELSNTPESAIPFHYVLLIVGCMAFLLLLIIAIIVLKIRQAREDAEDYDYDAPAPRRHKRNTSKNTANTRRKDKRPRSLSNASGSYTVKNFNFFLGYNKVQLGKSYDFHLHGHYHK